MKIDREKYPILSKSDFDELLENLTELEMAALKESLEEWTEFDKVLVDKRFSETDLLSMANNVDMIQDEVRSLELKLKEWYKKMKKES
jgi:hypothetical protein